MRKIVSIVLLVLFCFISTVSAKEDLMTPSGISYAELKEHIDEYVNTYIGQTVAGANVVIVKDGKLIMKESYGYAKIENQIEVTPDTVFEWGSITKLLVWTSVMQLVEQGKLDLHEDIRAYLPDGFLTKLKYDTPITLLNLMHHDAGWEERYVDIFLNSPDEIKTLEEMLKIAEPYQVYEPGSVVAYSNYGVALAGFIVEQISGKPFYEYVHEHIFSVLDMKNTSLHPTQQDNMTIATKRNEISGYTVGRNGELVVSNHERIFIGLYPAGSAIGTIEDLAKFMIALMPVENGKSPLFQNQRTLEEMLTTSQFYDNGFPRNAHGFWKGFYAVDALGHIGSTDSFTSHFIFSKDQNLGIIILTNQQNEVNLTYGLPRLLFGQYFANSDNQEMLNVQLLEGSYEIARKPYKGFTKLLGTLSAVKIVATLDSQIMLNGTTYAQIAPGVFRSLDGLNDVLHVTLNDGKVEKIARQQNDLLPVSQSAKNLNMFCIFVLIFSLVYTCITLLVRLVRYIKNRKKAGQLPALRKWETLLLLSNFIPLINVIALANRTLHYVSYTALKVHFWINFAYIIIVVLCLSAILSKVHKNEMTYGQKIRYAFSGVSSLFLVFLIFAWDLYF